MLYLLFQPASLFTICFMNCCWSCNSCKLPSAIAALQPHPAAALHQPEPDGVAAGGGVRGAGGGGALHLHTPRAGERQDPATRGPAGTPGSPGTTGECLNQNKLRANFLLYSLLTLCLFYLKDESFSKFKFSLRFFYLYIFCVFKINGLFLYQHYLWRLLSGINILSKNKNIPRCSGTEIINQRDD